MKILIVISHCWNRDSEAYIGNQSQMYESNMTACAMLGSIAIRSLKNLPDGTFDINELKRKIKESDSSPWALNTLVCIENTHFNAGGKALPLQWIEALAAFCEDRYTIHMDGARILNAAIATISNAAHLVRHCDSVTFCVDKGLGSIFGSLLVGSTEFIERARSIRDMLGGRMTHWGMVAAGALFSIDNLTSKLSNDHKTAFMIATAIDECHSPTVSVNLASVETNMVVLEIDNLIVNSKDFCERMSIITNDEEAAIKGTKVKILLKPLDTCRVCLMTHFDLSNADVSAIIRKLKFVIKQYDNI